jgi:manganese-dependent inorganic pyrophosphatase
VRGIPLLLLLRAATTTALLAHSYPADALVQPPRDVGVFAAMAPTGPPKPIYVTGHRNPDTDSIAAAVGYAELKRRLDPTSDYVPVRLGAVSDQTRWVLEQAQAPEPRLLPHVELRARDVMRPEFPIAGCNDPVRTVGLLMATESLELVPLVDDDGALEGLLTERALARRYVRESQQASRLDAPTAVATIVDVLGGELVVPGAQRVAGRVFVLASDTRSPTQVSAGDVVVVGDREDAQRRAIGHGVGLLVTSNGVTPSAEVCALARERETAVASSPLDSYVTGRMITLSGPCRALSEGDPLTVNEDDLLSDFSEEVKDVHYRAAIAVDSERRPIGLVTRADLVRPARRRVLLVDHAEQAQSVPGVEHAEIVEILDHHHVGSIETQLPVRATFDPVGSTATLVIERFRQSGMEPSHPTAVLLLGGILSDTVILNSPTTTERDRAAVEYLERVLALDATAFGREMFERTSDVSQLSPREILARDRKEYDLGGGRSMAIAQIETVGKALAAREPELLEALRAEQADGGYALSALMVTDILAHATDLLVAGDTGTAARAFDAADADGAIPLPGVMSRKKQVAPRLLSAMAS